MHQVKCITAALGALIGVVVGACDVGPRDVAAEDTTALHDVVVANAHTILNDSLVDLSEALPHMTAMAEPEA